MATLLELKDEILKGRSLKRRDWEKYYAPSDFIAGPTIDMLADDWELEPLPKKKVTMYQVVYRGNDDRVVMSGYLYESKEAFVKVLGVPSDRIMRLIPVELELEVEVEE